MRSGAAGVLLGALLGCTGAPEESDPCAVAPTTDEGTAELGLGTTFTAVTDGQVVQLEPGVQGLWMFVGSARVHGLDVGDGERRAAVEFRATSGGQTVSLETGCRAREFVSTDAGATLRKPYFVPFDPQFAVNGATVELVVEVRDHLGSATTDQRTVVAKLPG